MIDVAWPKVMNVKVRSFRLNRSVIIFLSNFLNQITRETSFSGKIYLIVFIKEDTGFSVANSLKDSELDVRNVVLYYPELRKVTRKSLCFPLYEYLRQTSFARKI